MTRKTRSFIFTVATCALNIFLTISILLFLIVVLFMIVYKTTGKISKDSYLLQAGIPVIMIFGLVISLKLFTNLTGKIIQVFKLEDKLDPKIISRYSKDNML